ncbi:hypothetical protein CTA2_8293 [Colletotrichum tanaceti]|uniref:Uncharacterized protein n=1 Tax=Colletotrichum tanaceti TaxID=1306861 RepID=A0A4U6XIH9_9PEZI|nr:hypothetical protein CTA2_8293 [Colletotrichum tanaceti]TKW55162.1 hypothetical protein CTA1_11968 [Colletotrichum tanaceti]
MAHNLGLYLDGSKWTTGGFVSEKEAEARKRHIPFAAVHLCFSAAVIHLIDARPSNPNRQQAIRHLQTCIDALRDLRTAWWAWSERALRAVRLLAREWYQV